MAEWHLAAIRNALTARGWVIVEHPGDGYRTAGTWELRRPGDERALYIDFDGLDDMRTLPLAQSYGCRVRGISSALYFRRARSGDIWKKELAGFVACVETCVLAGDSTPRDMQFSAADSTRVLPTRLRSGASLGRRRTRRG
jgi:hypothetical protein